MIRKGIPMLAVLFAAFGCTSGISSSSGQYAIAVAFDNLSFSRPIDLQDPGDGTGRLFVVEQAGVIKVFSNNPSAPQAKTFLDIRNRVDDSGNEEGLLGLAFHPNYATNGYFFVNYTSNNPNATVIARYSVSDTDPDVADANSEEVLLTIGQPFGNHNGGQVAFGPDGMLYIAVGDGGSGGDPMEHGQNLTTLLGTILRIDIDNASGNLGYAIPSDNPFTGNQQGYREEIFAYGLRNPWRFSFDTTTGSLWTGDVGQNRFEEIDIIDSGKNYGWNVMEAFECFGSSGCDTTDLVLPVHAYPHESGNASVTGGHVYRGSTLPDLVGTYVYADFSSGRIWGLTAAGGSFVNELLVDTSVNISSFGVDSSSELFICAFDGRIYRLMDISGSSTDNPTGSIGVLDLEAYPNPFSNAARVAFTLASAELVEITVYDAVGRRVANLLDDVLAPGRHSVDWNGRSDGAIVAPGVYYVTLQHGETSSTLPVVYQPGG
ncbi:MAG: PQQ-dependent sugar dehydrogenase [Rhodothermia bacterium]|nr:PQQ-dependent sugar dehydrogenase [Rhodothermia bacterium]